MAWTLAATAAIALAGCDGGAAKPAEETAATEIVRLEYWTPFSGGDNQFMSEMVDRFNREHDAIEVVQTNSKLDDYYSRLRTAILAGSAPDVAIIHTTSMPQFVQSGYIEDVAEPARRIGLDWERFNPVILQSTVYEGKSYAVPLDTHPLVMYYNKAHLRAAGVLDEAERPVIGPGPDGYKAFLENIRAAVPPDVAPLALPSTRIDSVWLWWSLYNQMAGGGAFYNEDQTRSVLNNDKALTALRFVNDLYESELIPPDVNDSFKMFYDGKAAVVMQGVWGTGAFENAPHLDFGVVPIPVLYDQPAAWGDSHTLAFPRKHGMTAERREASLLFAKWLAEHGELWAKAGHVPSMPQVVDSEAYNALPYRGDYAAAANSVAYWPRHGKQWSLVEIVIREFEKMIYKRQSPEQALERTVELIDAELAR